MKKKKQPIKPPPEPIRPRSDLSYIVSALSWVEQLPACLYSLKAQSHRDFEVIVTDNSTDPSAITFQLNLIAGMKDARFKYLHTAPLIQVSDPYWSSEEGVKKATGNWLCFPCDDCYYPPQWAQRMLTCAYRNSLDLVLCGRSENGPETCGSDRYMQLELGTPAFPGYKPSFLVRREKFHGWINKPSIEACSGVDRTTLQYMVRDPAIRWGVARDVYYVHN